MRLLIGEGEWLDVRMLDYRLLNPMQNVVLLVDQVRIEVEECLKLLWRRIEKLEDSSVQKWREN